MKTATTKSTSNQIADTRTVGICDETVAKDPNLGPSNSELCLRGIQLRSKEDRQMVIGRIQGLLSEAISSAIKMQTAIQYEQRMRHDEETKRLYVQIERLCEAIRLLQRRHFEDIREFACGSLRSETLGNFNQGQVAKR